MNVARQLALHHQEVLISNGRKTIHTLTAGVLRQVENLRSQISKNAILALGDMFIGLGTRMDPEVIAVISSMVKRCGDQATSFLSESAEMTLCHLIDNASTSRSLNGLLTDSDNRNPTLRGKTAGFLHFLMIQKAQEFVGCRELDGLKVRLKALINVLPVLF